MRVPPDDRKPRPKANVSELLIKNTLLPLIQVVGGLVGVFAGLVGAY